jgi:hypothetical protein
MAYCTVNDLNDYAAHVDIDDYSDPTATEVEAMITTVETWMNQQFKSVGVTVPVTDSDLLEVVKKIAIYGTLAEYYRAIDMEPEREERYQSLYDDTLQRIVKNPSILQTGTGNTTLPSGSGRTGDPTFSRGGHNW